MEETITVKVEDLQNLWKELDDLHTDLADTQERFAKIFESKKYQTKKLMDIGCDVYGGKRKVKALLGITNKLLGMKE